MKTRKVRQMLAMVLAVMMLVVGLPMAVSAADSVPRPKGVPDDASFYNGHYYYVYNSGTVSTWEEAKKYCENLGGHLAVIESKEENTFLNNLIHSKGIKSAYFGYSDAKKEGQWEWVFGKSEYTNWHKGEPNSENKNENYAQLYYKWEDGTWNDGDFAKGTFTDGNAFICEWENIYNIGEESYNFENYSDRHSNGHCFGMSMTSSAYYIGLIDYPSATENTYSLPDDLTTRNPICYYHGRQGSNAKKAVVAGKNLGLSSDWDEVVAYVKNHNYDGTGSLQIGYGGLYTVDGTIYHGGHAINFLRYEEVNGKDRIYAYDNNFPKFETYFYKDSKGNIRQMPSGTFDVIADYICLRSVETYFSLVGNYSESRFVYANENAIEVENVSPYLMETDLMGEPQVLFELDNDITEVTIKPLKSNAQFRYMDKVYTFSEVDENTVGVLKLAESDDEEAAQNVEFTITGAPEKPTTPETKLCSCNCHKTGIVNFFWKIGNFFHRIFGMNKYRECPCGNKMHW